MCSSFLSHDFDEIFDEANDFTNDFLNADKFLSDNDILNINSSDFNFNNFPEEITDSNGFNSIERDKEKNLDFDLPDFSDVLEPSLRLTNIKNEPTYSNSLSSGCITDDSSHPSSINSSPVGRKVKKRDHASTDSSSEKSFALNEEITNYPPKTAKIEVIKTKVLSQTAVAPTPTIYKLNLNEIKTEPRPHSLVINRSQGNIVTIRNNHSTSYIVHKVNGNLKTVNVHQNSAITRVNCDTNLNVNNSNGIMLNENTFLMSPKNSSEDSIIDQDLDYYSSGTYYEPDSNGGLYSGGYGGSHHHLGKAAVAGGGTLFQHPIPTSGTLYLTEEEKRTLIAEGYAIPSRLPLTKQEERNLKKVRRKIKNKISAQESRRKKKEYLDALEKKVEMYEQERSEHKKKIEMLENTQRTLQNQIRHLQQQLMNKITGTGNSTSTGLMLFMFCFVLFLFGGGSSYRQMNLPQSSLISSSSIYYMGYGSSRNSFNFSNHHHHREIVHDDPQPNSMDFKGYNSLLRRQSILLGDDSDDVSFEEWLRHYARSKWFCETNQQKIKSNKKTVITTSGSLSLKNVTHHQSMGPNDNHIIDKQFGFVRLVNIHIAK